MTRYRIEQTPQPVEMDPFEIDGDEAQPAYVPRETTPQLQIQQRPSLTPPSMAALPSGEISGEQQEQIRKRMLNLDALESISNLGNGIANVLKPGSASAEMAAQTRSYDRQRDLAKMPIAQAAQARSRAMQDQEYQRKVAEDQEDRENKQLQATKLREHLMPGTETAKRAVEQYRQKLRDAAMSPGLAGTDLAKTFAQRAESANYDNMSAQDIAALSKDLDMFSTNGARAVATQNAQAIQQQSADQAGKRQDAQTALGYGMLSETRREHDLQHQDKQDALAEKRHKIGLTIKGAQNKLNAQINDIDQAVALIDQTLELKKKVGTGPIESKVGNALAGWDLSMPGENKKDRVDLRQKAAAVNTKIRHELAGSALSDKEAAYIDPLLGDTDKDDDDQLVTKLQGTREQLLMAKKRRAEEYQRVLDENGEPTNQTVDTSVTAQKATQGAHPNNDPPGTKRKQGGKTYEKQADGSWKEVP